jgi:hypothetical protein
MSMSLLFDENRDALFIVFEAPFTGNASSLLVNTDEGTRPVHLYFSTDRPRRWTAGRCRPIDFLQERQLTTR